MVISTCCCGRDSQLGYLRQCWKSVNRRLITSSCKIIVAAIGNMQQLVILVVRKIVYGDLYSMFILYLRLSHNFQTMPGV